MEEWAMESADLILREIAGCPQDEAQKKIAAFLTAAVLAVADVAGKIKAGDLIKWKKEVR